MVRKSNQIYKPRAIFLRHNYCVSQMILLLQDAMKTIDEHIQKDESEIQEAKAQGNESKLHHLEDELNSLKEYKEHHPEDGARAALVDGDGNACDVAKPNRSRKRRTKGLAVGHFARCIRVVVSPTDHSDGVFESEQIDEPCPESEADGAENEHQYDDRDFWGPLRNVS